MLFRSTTHPKKREGRPAKACHPSPFHNPKNHHNTQWCQQHVVIFVDGIHLGCNAAVVIAQTLDHVPGWYKARSENLRAWGALTSRIAPSALVITDEGSVVAKASKKLWPTARVQRCTFHAHYRIKQAATTRPTLKASRSSCAPRSLYSLGRQLQRDRKSVV